MSVNVAVVLKDGTQIPAKEWQCFGFAYSAEGTKDFCNRYPKEIQELIFTPHWPSICAKNAYWKGIFSEYLTKIFSYFMVQDRIHLVSPEKGVLSVFSDGVKADVTELSGQEWVGLFELVRNCQMHPNFVQWVVELHRAGVGWAVAMWACRWARLPVLSEKKVVISGTAMRPPQADTTPSVCNTCLLLPTTWRRNRHVFKPWSESCDFAGVYYFFHGEQTPLPEHTFRGSNRAQTWYSDSIPSMGLVFGAPKNDLEARENFDIIQWGRKFFNDLLSFKSFDEVVEWTKTDLPYDETYQKILDKSAMEE